MKRNHRRHSSSNQSSRVKSLLTLLPIACSTVLMTGCLGPRYSAMKASLPPVAQNDGRIFFCRPADERLSGGLLVSSSDPVVRLNGQKVGRAEEDGFF